MAYTEFTLDNIETNLGIVARQGDVFPELPPSTITPWLQDTLARGLQLALVSEKARSEFIVAPILLAVRELTGNRLAILSGQRLDVDEGRRLQGECDFILALSDPVPRLRAPVMTIVEAKKNDIDSGLGPCIAQMVAARMYNDRWGYQVPTVYGCVTTGEDWQFLRLAGSEAILHRRRLYIDQVGGILAVLCYTVELRQEAA